MNKITADHLARRACVYIRQSTPDQVRHNLESQRRQYSLADRARALGWQDVDIIDEDLGTSGSGTRRPGFEGLLRTLCDGQVGAVFSIEASRLARNGRDWHTLLEFCNVVGALLIDAEAVYDPRLTNDRLLLGMKGTISEMEVASFRERAQAALLQKAQRGALVQRVAIGYVKGRDGRIEKDPDARVRATVDLIFRKFAELGSVRQVYFWLDQQKIQLPVVCGPKEASEVVWHPARYHVVLSVLKNPVYAGAYAYGRSKTMTRLEAGRKRVVRQVQRRREDWTVLILDHHEGYIAWDVYQSNQTMIAHNDNARGDVVRGSVKHGAALLTGLLRCGHCGAKLLAQYPGPRTARNATVSVLSYPAMRVPGLILAMLFITSSCAATVENNVERERRQRVATAFHNGILLLHANSELDSTADGFRQDPFFYYFTGLGNTVGAVLAIDGKSGESWLFLPSEPPFLKSGLQPEVKPGPEAAKRMGIEHVVDWTALQEFLASHAGQAPPLYYANDLAKFAELPRNLLGSKSPGAPIWLQIILQRWPAFEAKEAGERIQALMAVQSAEEIAALRSAAKATVTAVMAGMRAIQPGVSQRSVEAVVEDTCWKAGAHGSSFWPWAMSGDNAVFPRPFTSLARYDHLDQNMRSGDLVRLDVGCEWDHYIGDLGRTVPVSGHYNDDQRETWNIFVGAYRVGAFALRDGATVDQIFDAWRTELLRHRASAKTLLAQRAIDSWSDRKNVPYWQVHTTNLLAGFPVGPLREGTTINFEPIASIDGQGFFLEDMYLITKGGAELLTPGVPYSADEIEVAMH